MLLVLLNLIILILFPSYLTGLPFYLLCTLYLFSLLPRQSKYRIGLYGAVLVMTAAALSLAVPPAGDEAKGSPLIDELSRTLRKQLLRVMPELPITYNLPGFGHSLENANFDGSRPFLSNTPLFRVDAAPGTIIYLTTDIAYTFNGRSWITHKDPQFYRPIESLNRLAGIPENTHRSIKLQVAADIFPKLPITRDTAAFKINETIYELPEDTLVDISQQIPLSKKDELILYTYQKDTPATPGPASETRIPNSSITAFAETAAMLKGDSPEQTLGNIRDYFSAGFTYSLETEASKAPIEEFLFTTKNGYCVHFSSAAAVLAAINEIPVRIAKGFFASIPPGSPHRYELENTSVVITGYAAHQWPEIFIEGRGWVPWEVTPPMISGNEENFIRDMSRDRYTRDQLISLGVITSQDTDESRNERTNRLSPNPYSLLILPALLTIFLVWKLILAYTLPIDLRISTAAKRLADRLCKKRAIAPPSHGGWIRWEADTVKAFGEQKKSIQQFTKIMIRYAYDPLEMTREEKRTLEAVLTMLLKAARKKNSHST